MPLKSAKEVRLGTGLLRPGLLRLPDQVVDQDLGLHLLLDVEGRGMDDEVRPVLLVLAAPDELGVEVPVAAGLFVGKPGGASFIGDPDRGLLLLAHDGVEFGRGDVLAPGLLVGDRFYGLLAVLVGHGLSYVILSARSGGSSTSWPSCITMTPIPACLARSLAFRAARFNAISA